jgi:hypothetical protein
MLQPKSISQQGGQSLSICKCLAHFITSSEKVVSEPNWVGYVSDDIESELTRSQQDSLGETERQRIEIVSLKSRQKRYISN